MLILENQTEVFACGDSAKPTQKLYRYGYPSTKHEAGIDAFQNDPVKRAAWIKKLLEVWSLRKADPAAFELWKSLHQAGVDAFQNDPVKRAQCSMA